MLMPESLLPKLICLQEAVPSLLWSQDEILAAVSPASQHDWLFNRTCHRWAAAALAIHTVSSFLHFSHPLSWTPTTPGCTYFLQRYPLLPAKVPVFFLTAVQALSEQKLWPSCSWIPFTIRSKRPDLVKGWVNENTLVLRSSENTEPSEKNSPGYPGGGQAGSPHPCHALLTHIPQSTCFRCLLMLRLHWPFRHSPRRAPSTRTRGVPGVADRLPLLPVRAIPGALTDLAKELQSVSQCIHLLISPQNFLPSHPLPLTTVEKALHNQFQNHYFH